MYVCTFYQLCQTRKAYLRSSLWIDSDYCSYLNHNGCLQSRPKRHPTLHPFFKTLQTLLTKTGPKERKQRDLIMMSLDVLGLKTKFQCGSLMICQLLTFQTCPHTWMVLPTPSFIATCRSWKQTLSFLLTQPSVIHHILSSICLSFSSSSSSPFEYLCLSPTENGVLCQLLGHTRLQQA